jgi:hypothetical protein
VRRGTRRSLTEVKEGVATIRKMGDEEATTSNIAAAWVQNRFRVAYGNRSIDRVATLLQYGDADLGSETMCRNDHAAARFYRRT